MTVNNCFAIPTWIRIMFRVHTHPVSNAHPIHTFLSLLDSINHGVYCMNEWFCHYLLALCSATSIEKRNRNRKILKGKFNKTTQKGNIQHTYVEINWYQYGLIELVHCLDRFYCCWWMLWSIVDWKHNLVFPYWKASSLKYLLADLRFSMMTR